jgi:hypothetical protein
MRSTVSAMLRVSKGESGSGHYGKKKGSPVRKGSYRTDTATFRRDASGHRVYRALSCCAPRHGGPSFSIERPVAPLQALRGEPCFLYFGEPLFERPFFPGHLKFPPPIVAEGDAATRILQLSPLNS